MDIKKYDALETVDLPPTEIFSVGSWNGDQYELADLQAMIDAFNEVGFQPPVKAGHAEGQEDEKQARIVFGAPALGYIKRLYLSGKKLIADIGDVPKKFADLIKAGSYRRVSAEVFWQYKNEATGKIWPRVLKAISFLGADIPALTNLKTIESLFDKNAEGLLYAKDGAGNDFRLYEHDYQFVPFGPVTDFLLTSRRKAKADVSFTDEAAFGSQCGGCRFYIENLNACTLVEGFIDADDGCDLFEADSENYTQEAYEIEDFAFCPTGEGGGIDPTCGDGESSSDTQSSANVPTEGKLGKLKDDVLYKKIATDKRSSFGDLVDYLAAKTGFNSEKAHQWAEKRGLKDQAAKDAILKLISRPAGQKQMWSHKGYELCDESEFNNTHIYRIIKRGSKWCLIAKSTGKTLGCHATKEGAAAQEGAIKANKDKYQSEDKPMKLTRNEVREICPSCAESMETKGISALTFASADALKAFAFADMKECMADGGMMKSNPDMADRKKACQGMMDKKMSAIQKEIDTYQKGGDDMTKEELAEEREKMKKELMADVTADFDAKIAAAREQGAKDVETRYAKTIEDQGEQIKKMETQKRSDGIDRWIDDRKREGKIAPVEEPRMKAFLLSLEDGKTLTYSQDGKEASMSQADLFKDIVAKRPSLFKVLSKTGDPKDGEAKNYASAGDEVHAKALEYQKEHGEKDYRTATAAVLTADPDLNERYMRLQN